MIQVSVAWPQPLLLVGTQTDEITDNLNLLVTLSELSYQETRKNFQVAAGSLSPPP